MVSRDTRDTQGVLTDGSRLLNGMCFAWANLIFCLRVFDDPHVWKLSGGIFARANSWVAACFNLIFLSVYVCRTLRASVAAVKCEKKE